MVSEIRDQRVDIQVAAGVVRALAGESVVARAGARERGAARPAADEILDPAESIAEEVMVFTSRI